MLQMIKKIFHSVVWPWNLAQMLRRVHSFNRVYLPCGNPRWVPLFKMATISACDNTTNNQNNKWDLVQMLIKSYYLIKGIWNSSMAIFFSSWLPLVSGRVPVSNTFLVHNWHWSMSERSWYVEMLTTHGLLIMHPNREAWDLKWASCLMGNFVVRKSKHYFSALPLDHAHEQANAVIKADGGAIGLPENPSASRRWIVSGPEVSHLVYLHGGIKQRCQAIVNLSVMTFFPPRAPHAKKTFLERIK